MIKNNHDEVDKIYIYIYIKITLYLLKTLVLSWTVFKAHMVCKTRI